MRSQAKYIDQTIRVYSSVANVRSTTDGYTYNPTMSVNGYIYLWDPVSTSVDDGDTVIQITGIATGRYLKSTSGGEAKSWKSLANIGFTTLDDATYTTDTTFALDGVNFQTIHTAQFYAGSTKYEIINQSHSATLCGLKIGCPATANLVGYQTGNKTHYPIIQVPFSQWAAITYGVPVRASVLSGPASAIASVATHFAIACLTAETDGSNSVHIGVRGAVTASSGWEDLTGIWHENSNSGTGTAELTGGSLALGVTAPDGVGRCSRLIGHFGADPEFANLKTGCHYMADRTTVLSSVTVNSCNPAYWGVQICANFSSLDAGSYHFIKKLVIEAYY